MKLTPKQKSFADNYIKTGNATQSAISAGYSERSARQIATENLTKPSILEYIDKVLRGYEFDTEIRQRQALDYAIRVLHEEETEEHAFVVEDEGGAEEVQVVRLKPKIRDRMDAAKFITSLSSTVERNRLQNVKLEQEIKKLKKDLETDTNTEDKLEEYFTALGRAFRNEKS